MKTRHDEMTTKLFRNPRSERHWRNKQREMEKQQRKQPTGRVDWEEVES